MNSNSPSYLSRLINVEADMGGGEQHVERSVFQGFK